MSRPPHFLDTLAREGHGGLVLAIAGRDRVLADLLEPAFDSRTRTRGLLGRDGLHPGEAMIIAPCSAIHTFGMRFAIDVIHAARDGRVLKVQRAMPRSRVSAAFRTFAVIEMAAGSIDRAGLQCGDRLVVRPGDALGEPGR